jgi:hypothetical protein
MKLSFFPTKQSIKDKLLCFSVNIHLFNYSTQILHKIQPKNTINSAFKSFESNLLLFMTYTAYREDAQEIAQLALVAISCCHI